MSLLMYKYRHTHTKPDLTQKAADGSAGLLSQPVCQVGGRGSPAACVHVRKLMTVCVHVFVGGHCPVFFLKDLL